MIRLAHVLFVDPGKARAAALRDRLTAAGYSVAMAATAAEGATVAGLDQPDLVLIGDIDGPVALATALKGDPATIDIPILLVADPATPELCAAAVEAKCDGVLSADCGEEELLARIRPLGRLATMHAELRVRAAVAQAAGVRARHRVDSAPGTVPAVLVVGDQVDEVRKVLGTEVALSFAETLFDAEEALGRRNFDAAVMAFAQPPASLLGFCAQVRHNPRLFNLPLLLIGAVNAAEAYRAGATRVLEAHAHPQILRAAVLILVRRQQLRWTIRAALADSLTDATRDAETGAYNRAFFDDHLNRRLAIAAAGDRHLSVACFAAPTIDDVRRQFGEDAAIHLTQQVGQWIAGLLRAEDLVARIGRHEFGVVLPDTPLAEAELVMHRIAGVVAYTDFAVREVYQPVKVWVQVGATDARPGDDLAILLARARHNFD